MQRLRSLNILDSEPEEQFDRLTRLASLMFDVPIALVSLVDEKRQWFKSKVGLDASETHRDISFCGHTILQDDVFVIPDARSDLRFADNPLVTDAPYIRFYAGCPIRYANGSKLGTLCIIDTKPRELDTDVRNGLIDLARIVENEIHYRTLFNSVPIGLYRAKLDGTFLSINDFGAKLLGTTPKKVTSEQNTSKYYTSGEDQENWQNQFQENDSVVLESQTPRFNGSVFWSREIMHAVRDDDGNILYIDASIEDITERKELLDKLNEQAHKDCLTKLPNRSYFLQYLESALPRLQRSGRMAGLMFIDIDLFKSVNDTYGHGTGDAVFIEFCSRIRSVVRESDLFARIAGDEFAIFLKNVDGAQIVERIADEVIQAFQTPILVNEHSIRTTCSIGVSMFPVDTNNIDSLLNFADIAMYQSKRRGRNKYQFYSASMQSQANQHKLVAEQVVDALIADDLQLHYQPIYCVKKNQYVATEALLRVPGKEGGFLDTQYSITVAEQSDLIDRIGLWVLDRASNDVIKLGRTNNFDVNKLYVNVSLKQLREDEFVTNVMRVLQVTDLNPERLVLELTETSLMESPAHTIRMLEKLKAIGVSIVIDDFGTGQSSLSYLAELPVDGLKIDRSFTSRYLRSEKHSTIVSTIVNMAHSLGLYVVAEGVEDRKNAEALIELGCEYLQGFYFSEAIPFENLSKKTLRKSEELA